MDMFLHTADHVVFFPSGKYKTYAGHATLEIFGVLIKLIIFFNQLLVLVKDQY